MRASSGFDELEENVSRLHAQGKFTEALRVALFAAQKFPAKMETTSYLMASAYSRLGKYDEAIRALQDAMTRGYWWWNRQLLADPDLEPLRAQDAFKAIVVECERRAVEAKARSRPELLVKTPPEYLSGELFPMLLALHGRGENAREYGPRMRRALSAGLILALPQSSQPLGRDNFCWDEREKAEKEVVEAYGELKKSYKVDTTKVILAGFSQGGELAVYLSLKQSVPSRGFIAVAPAIWKAEMFSSWIAPARDAGLRGWIFTGGKDFAYSTTKKLHDEMSEKDFQCQLSVEPDLGHYFPSDFDRKLSPAISFIFT